jgi:hypothetical protein
MVSTQNDAFSAIVGLYMCNLIPAIGVTVSAGEPQRPRSPESQLARCFPPVLGVMLRTLEASVSPSGVFVRGLRLAFAPGTVFDLRSSTLATSLSLALSRDPRKDLEGRLSGLMFRERDLWSDGVGVVLPDTGVSGAEACSTRRMVAGVVRTVKSGAEAEAAAKLEGPGNDIWDKPTLTHGLTVYVWFGSKSRDTISRS